MEMRDPVNNTKMHVLLKWSRSVFPFIQFSIFPLEKETKIIDTENRCYLPVLPLWTII